MNALSLPLRKLGAFVAALGLLPTHADAPAAPKTDVQQLAYRSSIAQESVRKQATSIQGDLSRLIAELKLNGLSAADAAQLARTAGSLSSLSQEDIQKVIDSLQSASLSSEDQNRQQSLVSAYEGQKDVTLKFKTLAAQLAAQEARNAIPARLEALIARQSANIRKTTTLQAAGAAPAQLNDKLKVLHQLASAEQTGIAGEIDLLFQSLGPASVGSDPSAKMAQTALGAMQNSMLQTTAPLAAQLTADGPFPQAVAKQTDIRNYLAGVLRALASKLDATAQLEAAKAQLDQLAADQKELADEAKQSKLDAATVAQRQAQLNDRADAAAALVQPLNDKAADKLASAQKAMDQASADLAEKTPPADAAAHPQEAAQQQKDQQAQQQQAAQQQQQAADALADASKQLDSQLADLEKKQDESPAEKSADLQKLQNQISQVQQDAQTDPQQAAKDLDQMKQDDLGQLSQDESQKLDDAADKLKQAQPDTDGAKQDLAAANDDLQKQKDDLAKDAQDFQALAKADQTLADAEKQTTDADQNLQKGKASDPTAAGKDLNQAADDVQQVGQNVPSAAPDSSKQALQTAADALKSATNNDVQGKVADADAQAKTALDAIKQARGGLAKAMADAKENASASEQANQMSDGKQSGGPSGQKGQGLSSDFSDKHNEHSILAGNGGANGPGQVIGGLKPRDREAITQYQAEKAPAEYAPMVQQYMKNLADSNRPR